MENVVSIPEELQKLDKETSLGKSDLLLQSDGSEGQDCVPRC